MSTFGGNGQIHVEVKVDTPSLESVQRRLGKLGSKAPQVMAKALNKTAKQARRRLSDKAREAYTIKTGKFNASMKIKNASGGNLVAIINSEGRPEKLSHFKNSAPKSGAKAQVVAAGGLKPLIKGNIKAWKGLNGLIWQRVGQPRLPIKALSSNSIPKMIGTERRVYGIVKKNIQSDLQKNIEYQIKRLVG